MNFTYEGLDHVQLAAPPDSEQAARDFFGRVLGWTEVPKPEPLRSRGGVWFVCGAHQVHIGVQRDFVPATKAHPAFLVHGLERLREHLLHCGVPVIDDDARADEGAARLYVSDPWGNRLEFMEQCVDHLP